MTFDPNNYPMLHRHATIAEYSKAMGLMLKETAEWINKHAKHDADGDMCVEHPAGDLIRTYTQGLTKAHEGLRIMLDSLDAIAGRMERQKREEESR